MAAAAVQKQILIRKVSPCLLCWKREPLIPRVFASTKAVRINKRDGVLTEAMQPLRTSNYLASGRRTSPALWRLPEMKQTSIRDRRD